MWATKFVLLCSAVQHYKITVLPIDLFISTSVHACTTNEKLSTNKISVIIEDGQLPLRTV